MRNPTLMLLALGFALAPPLGAHAENAAAAASQDAHDRSEDLGVFRNDFLGRDNSFSAEARAKAEAMLSALEAEAGTLSDAAFDLRLAEIVALADNGHTLFFSTPWRAKYNRVPVKFAVFNGDLYIVDADDAHANLIGAEIVGIAGHRWADLRKQLSRYQGGKENWKATFIQNFIESPEVLFAAGLSEKKDRLVIDYSGTCKIERVTVKARVMDPEFEGLEALIPPARIVELARASEGEKPLYLEDADKLYRFQWLDNDVAYIQFKANAGESDGVSAEGFAADVLKALQARKPSAVILDERFNFGGDLNNTRDLMQALPDLVAADGKVYTLTSARTFSAGISSVGYLKQAGGEKVVIIGEPIGDRLDFWSEGDVMSLPQSGAMILYATERHNYHDGCPGPECHGSIKQHPIAVDSLAPDYPVPLTYEDYTAGRDPAMENALALIAAK